ncbi:uncharacterized protein LOC136074378 [Hydra vulgaris]|uniref:Uncharacterized protein LOC136074378 n=1 Tax=Hydra vulgaris TaxID=6087 RepID=A0ABM4B1U5_HYDVU
MIIVDNKRICDPRDIAHEFNKLFIDIGPKLANKIPFTKAKFNDFLVQMDNYNGSNEIYSKLSFQEFESNIVIEYFEQLKDILFKVYGASIHQGVFPNRLKIAKVTPILKEGDQKNISNYRPISVLCTFSKILERIMKNYFLSNNLLYVNQFGFKISNSTEHAVIQFVREISNSFEKSKYTLVAVGKKKDLSPRKRGQIKVLLRNTELTQCQIALKCGVTQSIVSSIKKNMQHGSTGTPKRKGKCGRKRISSQQDD